MGWWSVTILGGDTPLDYLGMYTDEIGGTFDAEGPDEEQLYCQIFTREQLEKNIDKAVALWDKQSYDQSIAGQVLGVMVLWTGAEISKELMKRIIQAANDDNAWSDEGGDADRDAEINAFVKLLEAHKPGQCVNVEDKGLFDAINETMGGV